MKVKRFFAPDMRQAMKRVRDEIGPDAVIVSNHRVAGGVEVVAAHENDYEVAQQEFTRKKKVTQKRQGQIDVLTKGRDSNLEGELQKARMQIAEANQAGRQNSDMTGKVNRQLDADDGDLRSILTSLKQRQKQKANVAFQNSLNVSALDESSMGLDLQDELSIPPSSSGGANDQMIRSMQDEIAQLKNLLSQQLATSQMGGTAHSKPPVQRKLELLGVSEKLSSHLLSSMDVQVSPDKAWKSALLKLSESIPVLGEDFIERGGMIAFVGPTGVGKTTTIGKLAARYVLK